MSDYEYDRYVTTKETLRDTLKQYGVAIIPNVLDERECFSLTNGMWDYFEHITQSWEVPIDRTKKESWKSMSSLYPKHSMLHQHWGCGHAQHIWNIRQNNKVVEIFATLWNCRKEDLLVSFDGFSFHLPPEANNNRGWFRNPWYHTDQSFTRNDFECVQSWVTGLDVEDNDATLAFYEGSHHFHEDFAKLFKSTSKADWYKLQGVEEDFYKERCKARKIKCPKGSLVFWDSRTIHCGVEANKNRRNKKFRAVVYLCYKPRINATPKNVQKKQKAFKELRMTSHWPCKGKLFPKNPQTYGGPIPVITPISAPVLTELGKKLAGF